MTQEKIDLIKLCFRLYLQILNEPNLNSGGEGGVIVEHSRASSGIIPV